MRISTTRAQRLAIRCQGLDGRWDLTEGKEGVAQVIERLGYVQIDTIAVVQRAHHHTLWSRCPEYAPQMLHELQAQDRRVFEYWTHAISYLPMCHYRYYLPQMRAHTKRPQTRQWLEQNAQIVQNVIDRIRAEGPLRSADFEAPEGFQRGTWWSWKPAKRALEMLFSMGELMVIERRSFQRVYDLTERVLPAGTDTTEPETSEWLRFVVRRVLGGLGVATASKVGWGIASRKAISQTIAELVDSGEVTPLEIEGLDGKPYYTLTKLLGQSPEWSQAHLAILSPFDNLVIRRERLRRLFGFDYSLECYLPKAKRRYGYFSLPILWGERFVARLDAKADRKAQTLIVRHLTFEPGLKDCDRLLTALAEKLDSFAAFNGCERTVIEHTDPPELSDPLRRELVAGE